MAAGVTFAKAITANSQLLIVVFLGILSIEGCYSTTVCSKIEFTSSSNSKCEICGCFDLEKMRGGFAGGDYDPHDDGIYQSIILRNDNTFELYQNDTLLWRTSYEIIVNSHNEKRNALVRLKLVDTSGQDLNYGISFEDKNHIWYGPINVIDAFYFMFVRH